MSKPSSATILFVSDTHFHLVPRPEERGRLERFLLLLDAARAADEIVLLGDIFDFWIDYPHFRMRGFEEILQALDRLRDAGKTLHFVGGNHDIWAAGYLHERYGTSPHGGPLELERDGRILRLVHGDGLLVRDWVYSSFRWLVRQPAGIALAKGLHPELLYRFCCWLSGTSRAAHRDERALIERRAGELLRRGGHAWDLQLMGHVHHPFILEHEGRRMAALGSWFDMESFGLWRDGAFSLHDFRDPFPL
ncbi:MAG TPA: UDP-2,3-diacylglucosamine diphosphatase [Candidatus Krumholzibacteria bacterium]|nr:UDP-2,3-diacylglucosamine diphosphatase [Candidatus Krumholzibacteria bacterium]HRX51130.1 UDP-2,3-diacylglucosamine diphosphatase [Candidatus Krumholzibacteria bacterium]